ncbi:MAG: M50 family metallopeptidase, partial [Anaerolineae bacterium]|nr:M50 family metallopeptidase [Anaerolineae bacterium]
MMHNGEQVNPRRDLALAAVAFMIALVLWQVQGLFFLTYPLRLFVTMIHELGHGMSAVLTGGEFLRFEVMERGAGLAYTSGGSRFIVIQAGYLGTAIFGATLLLL